MMQAGGSLPADPIIAEDAENCRQLLRGDKRRRRRTAGAELEANLSRRLRRRLIRILRQAPHESFERRFPSMSQFARQLKKQNGARGLMRAEHFQQGVESGATALLYRFGGNPHLERFEVQTLARLEHRLQIDRNAYSPGIEGSPAKENYRYT